MEGKGRETLNLFSELEVVGNTLELLPPMCGCTISSSLLPPKDLGRGFGTCRLRQIHPLLSVLNYFVKSILRH